MQQQQQHKQKPVRHIITKSVNRQLFQDWAKIRKILKPEKVSK